MHNTEHNKDKKESKLTFQYLNKIERTVQCQQTKSRMHLLSILKCTLFDQIKKTIQFIQFCMISVKRNSVKLNNIHKEFDIKTD